MPRRYVPCLEEGCQRMVCNLTGYCVDHFVGAKKCLVVDCDARVAAYSKSGYCNAHRKLGRTHR